MKRPPYDSFPEIISDTIILRQVQTEDLKGLVEITYYDSVPACTIDDAREMQNKINMDYQKGESIHWGIADKQTNEILGTVGYYRGFDQGIGELGCVLKAEFRGKGFMTKAIELATEYGIKQIGLEQIIAVTTPQNDRAIKLLERLHFIKTATLLEDEIEYQFINKE